MREFLEDAFKHREDGLGRAQKFVKQALPKRLYKEAVVVPADGGFAILHDGRPVKTPGQVPVVVPVAGIAARMADEWNAQGEFVDAATMPTVRLLNSALESGADAQACRAEIVKFAANDLTLYRAETPKELVSDQEASWDAALVALARHFDVSFQPTIGIIHQPQPPATLAKLEQALADESLLVLIAMLSITGITGSGVLALGLWHKLLTPEEVWTAAHVDEDFQIRLWGEDEEASERRAKRRIEFDTAVAVLDLLRD